MPQFKWTQAESANLQKIWDTFFLVYETLDEFNIHYIHYLFSYNFFSLLFVFISFIYLLILFDECEMIKPVWTQLSLLFANSEKIEFAWIEVLLRKGLLLHPNVSVAKLLTLDFAHVNYISFYYNHFLQLY